MTLISPGYRVIIMDMRQTPIRQIREEEAIVLDFLPNGYPDSNVPLFRRTAIAQAIGTSHFSLLELVPKKGVFLQPLDTVYIGDGKRDQIHHISGKLNYDKLTQTAKLGVEPMIKDLVKKNETMFVNFFNNSSALSVRMHQLELLPGLGKKNMQKILELRRDEPFKSLADIKARAKIDPERLIVHRIVDELEGREKHNLFTSN